MSNQKQYKFLDMGGVGTLKEEFDKVIDNSENSAKKYADSLNVTMDARVDKLENNTHTHENRAIINSITSKEVTNWNNAYNQIEDVFDVYTNNNNTLSDVLMSIDSNATKEAKSYVDTQIKLLPNTYYTETEINNKVSELNNLINSKADDEHEHNYAGSSTVGGSATSAEKLSVERTISLTGDVTGSGKFDGSKNISIVATVADDSHNHIISNVDGLQEALDESIVSLSASGKTITYTRGDNTTGTITTQDTVYTHPNSGVTAGTYKSVTVDEKGHIITGSNPTTLAGYGITDAEAKGTASGAINSHNISTASHSDIREEIKELANRLNAVANSNDTDLDQLAEIVAYIKSNRTLIENITTTKVNVSDIINNLTTNVSNKPLSASQGVALKELIDGLENNKVDTVTTTGNGNAITLIEKSGDTITATKGATFLTAHPTISKETDATSKTSPKHGETFTAVDSVTRDGNGHVTKINTKTVTLPSETQLSKGADISGTAQSLKFGDKFTVMTDTNVDGHKITDKNTTFTLPSNVATNESDGLMSAQDKVKLDATNIAYCTCNTDAAIAEKIVVVNSNNSWSLTVGSIIMVSFTISNTASNVKLNVNGTGAYPIWYNNAEYESTGNAYTGYANRVLTYMFNGTHWVWVSASYDANTQSNTNSTNTSNKIYLVGATSQGSNKTTYSHDTAYVGTDGCVYSNSQKTLTVADTLNADAIKTSSGNITIWKGTKAQYNAITAKDENCLYIIVDDIPKQQTWTLTLADGSVVERKVVLYD